MAHGRFLDPVHRQGNLVSIYDPFSTKADGSRTPIPGNRIPTNQIDPVAAKLLSFWKRGMIKEALAFALGAPVLWAVVLDRQTRARVVCLVPGLRAPQEG